MKIEITHGDDGPLLNLTEVFNAIQLQNNSLETFLIAMRDKGFEFKYHGKWYYAKRGIVDFSDTKLQGSKLIVRERREQVSKHHFSTDDDAKVNDKGELIGAALFLLTGVGFPTMWETYKRDNFEKKGHIDRLITAGALIAAEIDRLLLKQGDNRFSTQSNNS